MIFLRTWSGGGALCFVSRPTRARAPRVILPNSHSPTHLGSQPTCCRCRHSSYLRCPRPFRRRALALARPPAAPAFFFQLRVTPKSERSELARVACWLAGCLVHACTLAYAPALALLLGVPPTVQWLTLLFVFSSALCLSQDCTRQTAICKMAARFSEERFGAQNDEPASSSVRIVDLALRCCYSSASSSSSRPLF